MFTRRFTATVAGTALTAAALSLTALGLAGTAGASTTDDAFLAQIKTDGIEPPSDAAALRQAHKVCTALDEGQSSH